MTELHEILYCSLLAADQPPNAVGRIVSLARMRNAERGITGLLVFDGMRFCQHIEGPRTEVTALLAAIEQDPRHTDIRVVYDGAIAGRRYPRFDMGLAESEGSQSIADIEQLDGLPALQRFLDLRPGFDVSA